MRLQFVLGNFHTNQCSSLRRVRDVQSAADQFGALAHGHEADAPRNVSVWSAWAGDESFAVVFHFQLKSMRQKFKANPGLGHAGMAADVVKCFLNDAIKLD